MVVVILVLGGVALRAHGIAEPAGYEFDEEPFVDSARGYLVGSPDTNDHPPLGKLLMSIGILLFGDDPLGWRFMALLFGLQSILVARWLSQKLFSDDRAGWLAAAFVAGDGFFIAYSRAALLDGILTCLVLWSMLAAVTARNLRGVLTASVLVGLAMSVKWSGALAVVPAVAAVVLLGRAPRWTVAGFVLAPLIHALLWAGALHLTGEPNTPSALLELMTRLFRHHVALGLRDNPQASPWYSWPALVHPIVVKHSPYGFQVKYASSLAHPILFAATTVTVIGLPISAAVAAIRGRLPRLSSSKTRFTLAALLLSLGWLAMLAPWMVGRGKYTFWYHYMPSYGFGLVLIAGAAARLERKSPRAVALLGSLALVTAAWLAPVWGELPLREEAANRRLIFGPWRPRAPATISSPPPKGTAD